MSLKTIPPAIQTMSVSEVSEATGFPKSTIYQAYHRGLLQALLPNGNSRGMRFTVDAVKEWYACIESRIDD